VTIPDQDGKQITGLVKHGSMKSLYELYLEVALEKNKWSSIPKEELEDYKQLIYDLVSNAYSSIGGHSNIKSPDDIVTHGDEFDVINLDDDPDPDAVTIAKKREGGKKFVATGHDGSSAAKSAVVNHKATELKQTGYYIEASGKMAEVLIGKGVAVVTDEDVVRKVLKGKELEWHGDGSYTREIGGEKKVKVLLGKPTA
jgi:hypothetical protein